MATVRRRRAKNTGSIQEVDGVFYPRITRNGKTFNPTGRGYSTYEEAERALDKFVAQTTLFGDIRRDDVTVADFLHSWIATHNGKPTTIADYQQKIDTDLVPLIGDKLLHKLDLTDVRFMVAELRTAPRRGGRVLAARSINNIVSVLEAALNQAKREKLISENPAEGVFVPENDLKEITPWNHDQIERFMAEMQRERLYSLFSLIAATGIRRGEAVGLSWSSLELDGADYGVMFIRQTLVVPTGKGPLLQASPKTRRSKRPIVIPADVVTDLKAWKMSQAEERLSFGPGWGAELGADTQGHVDTDLVFTNQMGGAIKPDWVTRTLQKVGTQAGVPHGTTHNLRHAWATNAMKNGVSLSLVSEMLGHTMLSTTDNLYVHYDLDTMAVVQEQVAARRREARDRIGG